MGWRGKGGMHLNPDRERNTPSLRCTEIKCVNPGGMGI